MNDANGEAGDQVLEKALSEIVCGDPPEKGYPAEEVVLGAQGTRRVPLLHEVDRVAEHIARLDLAEGEVLLHELLRVLFAEFDVTALLVEGNLVQRGGEVRVDAVGDHRRQAHSYVVRVEKVTRPLASVHFSFFFSNKTRI